MPAGTGHSSYWLRSGGGSGGESGYSSIPLSGSRCASFTEIVPNKEGKNRTDAALDSLVDLLIYFNTD
jgi:hypothetical protein